MHFKVSKVDLLFASNFFSRIGNLIRYCRRLLFLPSTYASIYLRSCTKNCLFFLWKSLEWFELSFWELFTRTWPARQSKFLHFFSWKCDQELEIRKLSYLCCWLATTRLFCPRSEQLLSLFIIETWKDRSGPTESKFACRHRNDKNCLLLES